MATPDRPRAAVPDGGGARAAVARDERRGGAATGCSCRRGSVGSRCWSRWSSARAAWPRSSRTGSARSRPRASCASSCSASAAAGARSASRARSRSAARRARTRGSTAGSSCTSVSCSSRSCWRRRRRTARTVTCELRRGQSATVSGYTLTYLGSHTDAFGAEDHDLGRRQGRSRATACSAPTRRRSRPIPNSTEGIGTPSVHTGLVEDVYLTLVSSPNAQQRDHPRRAHQPDDRVALDRRWRHGARARSSRSSPRLRRRSRPRPVDGRRARAGTRATRSEPREEVTRVKHPARWSRSRSRVVVVVLGVVLALNVGNDPQQDAQAEPPRRQGGAGVRPPEPRAAGG